MIYICISSVVDVFSFVFALGRAGPSAVCEWAYAPWMCTSPYCVRLGWSSSTPLGVTMRALSVSTATRSTKCACAAPGRTSRDVIWPRPAIVVRAAGGIISGRLAGGGIGSLAGEGQLCLSSRGERYHLLCGVGV